MFGGPGGGSFFNLGTPEIVVIGAVAWAVLGPKELFKLARQAGEFLGEFQTIGLQAKQQFQDALEQELAEDEATSDLKKAEAEKAAAAARGAAATTASSADDSDSGAKKGVDTLPELADMAASREQGPASPESGNWFDDEFGGASASELLGETLSDDEEALVRQRLYTEMGTPEENSANFAEQMSGDRNAQVLAEYPPELGMPDEAPEQDGSPFDVQYADESLLSTQIAQAENQLQMLQAEKQVLALKRKQLQANAERAKRMAEERAKQEADEPVDEAETPPA
jgi:Sec-independent protein translocase protein TatA